MAPDDRGARHARRGCRPEMFRRTIAPLLAGYWAFGQYWGVWVILVYEIQRDNRISNAGHRRPLHAAVGGRRSS